VNDENLRSLGDLPPEERHAIAVRAGTASGAKRKRNADIRGALKLILQMPDSTDKPDEVSGLLEKFGVPDPTAAEGIAAAALLRARRGDMEAARYVRDSSGEMPTSRVEVAGDPSRPIASMDLTSMTDDQLRIVAEGLENASSCTDAT